MHPNLKIEPLPPMTLKDFAVKHRLTVIATEREAPESCARWVTRIPCAALTYDLGLSEASGMGSTVSHALAALADLVSGRQMTLYPDDHSYSNITVPRLSSHGFTPADLDGRP